MAGCTPHERAQDSLAQASQVIVRVNGEDISMLQYRRVLRQAGLDSPSPDLREELIEKLVSRELAVQQALVLQLERRPEVLLELEEARRDVLARAWAAETAATTPALDQGAGARYFVEHPELFLQRKIYHLRETALSIDLPQLPEIKQRLARGEPLSTTLNWLKAQGGEAKDQVVIRAAEQLPIESLPRLAATAEGETALFESPRGVIAYQVLAVEPAALTWEDAQPIIAVYLRKQAGKRAVVAQTAHLRRSAEIAYPNNTASAAAESNR